MELLDRCPLCGSADIPPRMTVRKRGEDLVLARCASCRLIFQNPRRSDPDSVYGAGYYTGENAYSYVRETSRDAPIWDARLARLERETGGPGRLLDVGCATGDLLAAAEARGWEAWGVDVSEYAAGRAAARLKSGRVLRGDVFSGALPAAGFDAVTLFEVLEHVAEPVRFMSRIRELLSPGGTAVIQTSNIDSLRGLLAGKDFYYFEPGHLCYYSRATVRLLLRKSGLRERMLTMGSELGLKEEVMAFSPYYAWPYTVLKRMAGAVSFGRITVGTVMVMYARREEAGG